MKKNFLPALILILICSSIDLFAQNTKLGVNALANVTTGNYNTAIGYYSLYTNTVGNYNSGFGVYSLYYNTSGVGNTANGFSSLFRNSTGSYNKADGYAALYSNTTGANNTALGAYALYGNSTASFNTATGSNALYRNTTGTSNTAGGYQSLYASSTGNYNTAYGTQSLYRNTSGGFNTSTGMASLYTNTTGFYNVANGSRTLYSNTTGNGNTATGSFAMYLNTTGGYNKADGYYALFNNTTGSYNTALGAYADVSTGGLTNATAIGYGAIVNASNKVVIGRNIAGMVIGGYAAWSNFSDGRYKENVKEDVPGLKFIVKLRPVTYTINTKKLEDQLMKGMPDSIKAQRAQGENDYARSAVKIQTGFIAQEVEKTATEMGYDFDGVNVPQNPNDNYSIAYTQFIMPLVKAVQELAKLNDDKDAKIDSLKKQVAELRSMVLTNVTAPGKNIIRQVITGASLEQNSPNPFSGSTKIAYTLPQQYATAQVNITDMSGKIVKQVNVSGAGKGNLQLDTKALSLGTYNYSLFVDGQLVGTKQMLLSK